MLTNCALILIPTAIITYFWFANNLYYINTIDYNCKTVWCIVRTVVTVDSLWNHECATATKHNGMLNIILCPCIMPVCTAWANANLNITITVSISKLRMELHKTVNSWKTKKSRTVFLEWKTSSTQTIGLQVRNAKILLL
jgi:hypothetical protein